MTQPDPHRGPIFRFPLTGARLAGLWTAVRDLQSRPRTAGYPPRIFISYRWEDEAVKAWCQRLADHLRRRGYEVLLDLEHLVDDLGPGGIEIARYVARIVDVQLVLRIITGPYVDGLLREWLLAEDQLTKLMAETGCVIAHVLLRDGVEPTDWGRHGTVDLREAQEDFSRLDALLPPYRGLALPAPVELELVELLVAARDLLAAGRPAEVLDLLARHPGLVDTFEVRQTLAHARLALGQVAQAVDAARSIERLPGRPTVETTIDLALILEEAGRPRDALCLTTKVIALPTSLQPRIRRMAGSLLDDLGAPEAALRQLRYALRLPETGHDPQLGSDLHNLLGLVLLFGLGAPDAALPHFVSGSALDAENQHLVTNHLVCLMTLGHAAQARQIMDARRGRAALIEPLRRLIKAIDAGADVRAPVFAGHRPPPTHVCSACDAGYRLDLQTALCAVCGATSPSQGVRGGWSCPYCSAVALSPVGLITDRGACPVCADGTVTPALRAGR